VAHCPQDQFAFFQLLEPVSVIGRSIWVYHLSAEEAADLSRRFGWGPEESLFDDGETHLDVRVPTESSDTNEASAGEADGEEQTTGERNQ
jgi:hypothetical protein